MESWLTLREVGVKSSWICNYLSPLRLHGTHLYLYMFHSFIQYSV